MPESRRILLVEDDQVLAMHLNVMLEHCGYTPLAAIAQGEEAVKRIEEFHPDLILMDIYLEGNINGIEASRQIQERFKVPVIFLSAMAEDELIRATQITESYGYLLKPVKENDLRAAIELALFKHKIESRLRQSEQRYRLLFEKMNNGFGLGEIICDETGAPVDFRFLAINPAFERMIRIRARRLVGRSIQEALPDFDRSMLVDVFGRVALTGEPTHFEFFVQHGDRYLEVSVFSPEIGQFATIVEDVSERKRAEKSLKESETRFRQLAEGVREVFWLNSKDNGQLLYVSPSYERIFGRPCSDLYDDSYGFMDGVHPEDTSRLTQAQLTLEQDGRPLNEEYRIIRPDGIQRWVWARSFPVVDESGQVTRYSGIIEDITERKAAEQQIRESYARIELSLRRMTILRNIDLAITTHNDLPIMAGTILTYMTDLDEIDGAVLFVPVQEHPAVAAHFNVAGSENCNLRIVGMSGLSMQFLSEPAHEWQQKISQQIYRTCEAVFISDLCEDPTPGAADFLKETDFHSCATLPLLARGQVKGVLQFFRCQPSCSDSDWQSFLQSLAVQTAIAIDNVDMFEDLKRSNRELSKAYDETIKGWAQALEIRDKETRGHCDRVTRLAEKLARFLRMDESALIHFRHGVMLHDIGKLRIPDAILHKPDSLSPDDWVIMRQHPYYGYEFLSPIEYLRPSLEVVYYHHEKWDGTGYPSGLKGEEIPLTARIFAVVDVYDALTNDRPYRPAWPKSDALIYIGQQSGKHFDPEIVEAFLNLIN
jgi:PAS domain S-box-containing protein